MELCKDYAGMYENIVQSGIDYLEKYPNIENMIVGLSGGIDSTVTAAIAREMCDRTDKHKLFGISIPIESNKKSEIEGARDAGKAFCHKFREVKWINFWYPLFRFIFYSWFRRKNDFYENLRFGNIKARFRMMYLYHMAHKYRAVVLSTDNLTEFNLGFWTLHGDVGDLGFIQQIWKTEVYGIANYLCAELDHYSLVPDTLIMDKQWALVNAIKAIPTDGLGISPSDLHQIGAESYREVDDLLIGYIKGGSKDKLLEKHPVIKRHIKFAFKRDNPHNIPREFIIPKAPQQFLDSL